MNTTRAAAPKVTFGKFSHALRVNEPYNGERPVYLNGVQAGAIVRNASVLRGGNASTDTIQVDGIRLDAADLVLAAPETRAALLGITDSDVADLAYYYLETGRETDTARSP